MESHVVAIWSNGRVASGSQRNTQCGCSSSMLCMWKENRRSFKGVAQIAPIWRNIRAFNNHNSSRSLTIVMPSTPFVSCGVRVYWGLCWKRHPPRVFEVHGSTYSFGRVCSKFVVRICTSQHGMTTSWPIHGVKISLWEGMLTGTSKGVCCP